jgi:hypothetical protein
MQLQRTIVLSIIINRIVSQAHGIHREHKENDGSRHYLRDPSPRHLAIFGSSNFSPPGQCKDGGEAFTIGGVTYECEADFNQKGGKCKSKDRSEEEKVKARQDFLRWKEEKAKQKDKSPKKAGSNRKLEGCAEHLSCVDWDTDIITVPTYFHVIHDGDKGRKFRFDVNSNYIINQIKALNRGYGGIPTNYPLNPNIDSVGRNNDHYPTADIDTKIKFCLKGTTATDNEDWYYDRDSLGMKRALDEGGMESLNVYVNTAGGYLGYAYFPTSNDSIYDGVVILNDSMPEGGTSLYSEGDTVRQLVVLLY